MKYTQKSLRRRMRAHCRHARRCRMTRTVTLDGETIIAYRKWMLDAAILLDDPILTLQQIDISVTFLLNPRRAISDVSDDHPESEPVLPPAAFADRVNSICEWLRQTLCRQTDQAAAFLRVGLLSAKKPPPPDDIPAVAPAATT